MRSARILIVVLALIGVMGFVAPVTYHGAAAAGMKTRLINSWEPPQASNMNEHTAYGNWTGISAQNSPIPGSTWAQCYRVGTMVTIPYHGSYSVRLEVVSAGGTGSWARATMTFQSNISKGTFLFDQISIVLKYTVSGTVNESYDFNQWNDTTLVDAIHGSWGASSSWSMLTITPNWAWNATNWSFKIQVDIGLSTVGHGDLYIDYFTVNSDQVDVRLRYWNLYTGLGYYAEKLLARYWTMGTWVDIWQNEFQAYKGDSVLVSVTDIFNRNVWTGIVDINSTPQYVDILVPIVTVHIVKPDWYNDTVPWEWQITCLPYGPDGPAGMALPAVGFEFECLAGWYSFSWLQSQMVDAGNQTVWIDGNISARRSFTITDLSLPINPEYEVQVNGGGGQIWDLSNFDDLVDMLAHLYDSNLVKAALLLGGIFSLFMAYRELNKLRKKALARQGAA